MMLFAKNWEISLANVGEKGPVGDRSCTSVVGSSDTTDTHLSGATSFMAEMNSREYVRIFPKTGSVIIFQQRNSFHVSMKPRSTTATLYSNKPHSTATSFMFISKANVPAGRVNGSRTYHHIIYSFKKIPGSTQMIVLGISVGGRSLDQDYGYGIVILLTPRFSAQILVNHRTSHSPRAHKRYEVLTIDRGRRPKHVHWMRIHGC